MRTLTLLASALLATPAFANTYVTSIDATTYNGATGTITFDDHGYTGPTGVTANDFQVTSTVTGIAGFDPTRVGQVQNVVTKDPDWLTSDPVKTVNFDGFASEEDPIPGSKALNANMDGTVNFFKWAYTTVGGSTFNNMKIDKAGNYFVAKNDMNFEFYDTFQYNDGVNSVYTYDTYINFKPYAISDGTGWCGSVLASSPEAVERMAGQLTFDFAFDVYLGDGAEGSTTPATQIVPDFVMRSYGSYVVEVKTSLGQIQKFTGSAVENNTNPLTGELDPDYAGEVSFLGAGVVPKGVWVFNDGTADVTVADVQGAQGTYGGQVRETDGATWHANQYGGYAFLLRADGTRMLVEPAAADWSDYTSPAPEPSTYAMMVAGLALVAGAVRRRRQA